MKFVVRKDTIQLPPIDERTLEKIHFSSKLAPDEFGDYEHEFINSKYKTTLAEIGRDDSARRAMRKDAT